MVTCDSCTHKEVCDILKGEMFIRFKDLRKFDLIKGVRELKEELAGECLYYTKRRTTISKEAP